MSDGRFIIQTFVARVRRSVWMSVCPGCLLRNRIIRNDGSPAPPPPPAPPLRHPPPRCGRNSKQHFHPIQKLSTNSIINQEPANPQRSAHVIYLVAVAL